MADSLLTGRFVRGTAANKSTIGEFPADQFGFYLETDTGALTLASTGAYSVIAAIGSASVTAPTTATTVTNYGTSTFNATAAKTYSLAAPAANVTKRLTTTTTATAAKTITLASGNIVSTAASTIQNIVLNGLGQTVELLGLSTAQYAVVSNTGATLS